MKWFMCPRCIKRAWWLEADAMAAKKAMRRQGKHVRYYRGRCGFWHLTNAKPKRRRRG